MKPLHLLAYHHYRYGGGWTDWMAHVAISSLIHALIYGTVFSLMHQLTLGETVVLTVVVVGCVFMWGRSRARRGARIRRDVITPQRHQVGWRLWQSR